MDLQVINQVREIIISTPELQNHEPAALINSPSIPPDSGSINFTIRKILYLNRV